MRIGIDYRVLGVGRHQIERGLGRYTQQQLRAVLAVDPTNEYVLLCNAGSDVGLLDAAVAAAPNTEVRQFDPGHDLAPVTDVGATLRQAEEFQQWVHDLGIDLYHATTPFIIEPPLLVGFDACPMVATFYDVIPLTYPQHYFFGDWWRDQYLQTLGLLGDARRLIAISEFSRAEARTFLGFPGDRIDVAWPIPNDCFRPLDGAAVEAALRGLRARVDLPARFVLTVSAFHHSKNLETLLRAYARLPVALRRDVPLVVACHLDANDRKHLGEAMDGLGLHGCVVPTGLVSDAELAALYNAATVTVHPSRYEGFGLPVVESMRCGTPVVSSSSTSLPEAGGEAALFAGPDDDGQFAVAIEELLGDEAQRADLVARGLRHSARFDAAQLAARTLESYRQAVAPPPITGPARPRIALWSPFPPQGSGVADYSAELVAGLERRYDVEVFVDDGVLPPTPLLRRHRIHHASAFDRRDGQDRFDVSIYQFGQSTMHLYLEGAAKARPGVAVWHDLAWSHVRHADAVRRGELAALVPEVERVEGLAAAWELAAALAAGGPFSPLISDFLDRHLMVGELARASRVNLVHLEATKRLLEDRHPDAAVAVVPMGVADPFTATPAVQCRRARDQLGLAPGTLAVGVFGVVDPVKRVETCLEAFRALRRSVPDAHLFVVGPTPDPSYLARLRERAGRADLAGAVTFTGHLERDRFDQHLLATDIVVNLRVPSTSHLSAIAVRAAAAAKAVLISDLPEWRSLPFPRVPVGDAEREALAGHLERLAGDPAARAAAGAVARHWYVNHSTVEAMVDGYAAAVDLVRGAAVGA